MKRDDIKDFTIRISGANKTELIVIHYEIALNYLKSAQNEMESGIQNYKQSLIKAQKCVDELIGSLNFDYEMSFQLISLYLYVNKCILKARIRKDSKELYPAIGIIEKLHAAFRQIREQDSSEPVMKNTHSVYAGLTYGKESLTETCDYQGSSRGFCI